MKAIQKKTLHQEIANNLREMIMSGELQEGDKIKENELCIVMEISKTPLREALRVLSAEGLIRLIPNRGSYVTTPTFEEIKEMFDVMSVLEGVCARTAAEKMSSGDFKKLEDIHHQLEKNFRLKDQKQYIHHNNLYHAFVQELAGNKTLNQIVNGLRQKILLYRFKSLNLSGRFKQSIQEHRDLLEAFRNRDAEKAELLMTSHMKKQSEALEKLAT
ncbi:MAG: GntR family transcriptional regulator [Deltaproteobacteria bacterium]|nr:GntR family transcriptional regulator [Deltaproteobacteria bacterium]